MNKKDKAIEMVIKSQDYGVLYVISYSIETSGYGNETSKRRYTCNLIPAAPIY